MGLNGGLVIENLHCMGVHRCFKTDQTPKTLLFVRDVIQENIWVFGVLNKLGWFMRIMRTNRIQTVNKFSSNRSTLQKEKANICIYKTHCPIDFLQRKWHLWPKIRLLAKYWPPKKLNLQISRIQFIRMGKSYPN